MNNEAVSKDELNALLNEDDKNDELIISDYLSDFESDAIGEIGNISFGSASTALSALLGQKVEITTPVLKVTYTSELSSQFPIPHIAVYVKYIDGFDGTNLFVLKLNDAKIIADLMLGGDGVVVSNDDLSEMDISAVQEAMNQMMGASATSMSTIFNRTVSISPPSVDILDIVNGKGNIPEEDVILLVSFKLKIGNIIDSNIMQIISTSFAKKMAEYLIDSDKDTDTDAITDTNTDTDANTEIIDSTIDTLNEILADSEQADTIKSEESFYEELNNEINVKANKGTENSEKDVNVQSVEFTELETREHTKRNESNLGLLMDIPLQVSVELGRTKKVIKDILELSSGSIIELDKLAGEPVNIYANNKLIAKGEVVVIDENFGVRITDIISQIDRVRRLQ